MEKTFDDYLNNAKKEEEEEGLLDKGKRIIKKLKKDDIRDLKKSPTNVTAVRG